MLTLNEQIALVVPPKENEDDPEPEGVETPCLVDVQGLEEVNKLETLEIKASGITKLEGFPKLPNLKKLDLSASKVEDINQLEHLGHLGKLESFSMAESPCAGVDDFKKEVMVRFIDKWPLIRVINEEPIAEDDAAL